jgi:hypothetical protein
MGEAGGFEGFELWWREQVPRLTGAYLPLLAAQLGGGMAEDAPAVRLWRSRVLPELRAAAATTVDDFERRLGRSVALTGIDVVTGTVGAGTHDKRRVG